MIHPMNMAHIDLGNDLLNYLVERGCQPGERLPSITELQDAEHLGVSASKIREQLEVARALGLVEVRSKTGIRLKEYSFTPAVRLSLFYALAADPRSFESFGAVRHHLEVAFWHEACALLTDEDRGLMRRCIEDARAKLTGDSIRIPYNEHRLFHLTVFKRLQNPFVTGLFEAYWDAYEAVEMNRYADYEYLRLVWDYHERILDAICAGDFDGAQAAFIEHTRLLPHAPRLDGAPAAGKATSHAY